MNIHYRRLFQVFVLLTTFFVTNSGKAHRSNGNKLKHLFHKIEHDKAILLQIDELKKNLRTIDFREERRLLKIGVNGTFYHSLLPENYWKNRYPRTLCFDHSRVILSTKNNMSDYIHASWVDGYKQKDKFILTQGNSHFV
jgi:protein tyrosine phosphatase